MSQVIGIAAIALILLTTSVQAEDSSPDVIPPGWLIKQGSSLRLQVVNETRQLEVPAYETRCLRSSVISQLLKVGMTVFLTQTFLQDEADRVDSPNKGWPDAQLATALRSAGKNGVIPWKEIDRIQKKFSHVAEPWGIPLPQRNRVKIASSSEGHMPILELAERWQSREYQKDLPVTFQDRGGNKAIWNLAVTMRLTVNGKMVMEKTYSQPPWQPSYNNSDSPADETRRRVMEDISMGLKK
jgi:hypothetical protein